MEQTAILLPDLPGIEKGWEILTVDHDRATGRYTAAHIAGNAAKRDAVVRALGEGLSIAAVARAFGMSRNTVTVAARRFGVDIEQRKKEFGAVCLDVARMAIERIRDEMDDMPKASLPIIAGVLIDKAQLLSGAPTARVEHTNTAAGPNGFNAWLESVVEVSAEPVAASGNLEQKGGALESGQVLEVGSKGMASDTPSPALSGSAIGEPTEEGSESGQKGGLT